MKCPKCGEETFVKLRSDGGICSSCGYDTSKEYFDEKGNRRPGK